MKLAAFLMLSLCVTTFGQDKEPEFFFHNAFMPAPKGQFSPYKGQPLDVEKKRPVVLLDGTVWESIYGRRPGYSLVTNIYHNKAFYVAYIPNDGVTSLYHLDEPFDGVSHTMKKVRFASDKPVELIGKIPTSRQAAIHVKGEMLPTPILLRNLLISTEVVNRQGHRHFRPIPGLFGGYALVIRVTSLTGRGVSLFLPGPKQVLVPERLINFSPQESQRALMAAITLSGKLGLNTMYHLLFRNCNQYEFMILSQARPFLKDGQTVCERVNGLRLAAAERIFPMARWYPPFGNRILVWRGYRSLGDEDVTYMNDDPEFLESAKTYPKDDKVAECDPMLSEDAEADPAE